MKRTTIMLSEDIDSRLRYEARRRGVSVATVARDAIEAHLGSTPESGRLSFFAIGDGKPRNASERVNEHVSAAMRKRAVQES